MSDHSRMNRRNFLRIGGLAAMTLPVAKVVGSTGDEEIVSSSEGAKQRACIGRCFALSISSHEIDQQLALFRSIQGRRRTDPLCEAAEIRDGNFRWVRQWVGERLRGRNGVERSRQTKGGITILLPVIYEMDR